MSQASSDHLKIGKKEILAAAVITALVSIYGFLMAVPPIKIALFVLIPLTILYMAYGVLRNIT
ncbi:MULTISPECIES: hypothetical protein [Halobacterium]|uniref:hypothetical protein n=1 Tax=Halobacterium TaxID=2239 RepID=UPI000B10ADAB|nr:MULTISPECIES: hypothetical protein [Halobacterium]MCG1004897.1 hypothetical protein [Halobacterium noricense]